MTWQWTPYTIPLLTSAAVVLAAAILVFRRDRYSVRSKVGALLLLGAAAWILGNALQVSSTGLEAKVAWDKLKFVGISTVPTVWLAYTLRYTGHERYLTLRNQLLLSIVPLVTFLLVGTNEAHGLIWRDAWLDTSGPFAVKATIIGVGFWAYTAYSYLLILVGLGVLLRTLIRSGSLFHLYRWQAGALLALVVAALLLNVAEHVFGWTAFHNVELTPFALALTAPIVAWASSRLQRRGVVPVARETVVEAMADALLVLDAENRILDLNLRAQEVLEADRIEVLGQAIQRLWPQWPDWVEVVGGAVEASQEVVLEKEGNAHTYELHVSPVLDWEREPQGRVVVLREITERVQAESRLRASLQEKEMLLQTGTVLTSSLDLGQVLFAMADQLLRVSGFNICCLYDWDREEEVVRTLAEHSHAIWSADHREVFRLSDFPTTDRVLTTGGPEIVHLGMDDPELTWMRQQGQVAILMLPLRAGEETIGLVEIGSTHSESFFDRSTVLRCTQMLRQAASGLVVPFEANPGDALLALAQQLVESSGASLCAISEWLRSKAEVQTVAEYSQMTWPLGQGPVWNVAEWPSVARVLASKHAVVARLTDPDIEPADGDDLTLYGAHTLVVLPILMKGEPIGVVELYDVAEERNIAHDEFRLWQGVADQAAVAIENARLHAQVQRQLRVETVLREAASVFSSTLESEAVLSHIAEEMARAIDATSAYICRFDAAVQANVVVAEYIGPEANAREQVSDLGVSYPEPDLEWLEMMKEGRHDTVHVDDPDLAEVERELMQQYGGRSILYIPLRVGEQPVGIIELWESRRRREFTADEIALCNAIAHNAVIALENAHLYERIQASLQEKEVLLQEIHHRVKNNLQIISSLLNLQATRLGESPALDALRDSQDRVRSMALVHEKLYQSRDLAWIDFASYADALAGSLFSSYRARARGISLHTRVDDVFMSIERAIPCGLILSELVSNALKHAFPDGGSGEIIVGLHSQDGSSVLTVVDDGVGLPPGIDVDHRGSLGLQLVNTLAAQLDGTLTLERKGGTTVTVTFPDVTSDQ
jgi:PAS domain S-box-containing protein